MRALIAILTLVISATAVAQSQQPTAAIATPGIRLHSILPATGQALVFDLGSRQYRLLRANSWVGEFMVKSIYGDQVLFSDSEGRTFFVYVSFQPTAAAAPPAQLAPAAPVPQAIPSEGATGSRPAQQFNYGPGSASGSVPAQYDNSYQAPAQPSSAPSVPTSGTPGGETVYQYEYKYRYPPQPPEPESQRPIRSVKAPPPLTPPAAETTSARAEAQAPIATAPAVRPAPSPPTAKPARAARANLSRQEMSHALSDFARLSREVQVEPASQGYRVAGLARGSLAYRLGLRQGDEVLRVAGVELRSMAAAALVYSRVQTAKTVEVALKRRGVVMTILVDITG
jgi:type II secretory pathway component PulC